MYIITMKIFLNMDKNYNWKIKSGSKSQYFYLFIFSVSISHSISFFAKSRWNDNKNNFANKTPSDAQ